MSEATRAVLRAALHDRREDIRAAAAEALGGVDHLDAPDRADVVADAHRKTERAGRRQARVDRKAGRQDSARRFFARPAVKRPLAGLLALLPLALIVAIVTWPFLDNRPSRVDFSNPGAPCTDASLLYLDEVDGESLDCQGSDYAGPLTVNEQAQVANLAVDLADGGLTAEERTRVNVRAVELAPKEGLDHVGGFWGLVGAAIGLFLAVPAAVGLLSIAFPGSATLARWAGWWKDIWSSAIKGAARGR